MAGDGRGGFRREEGALAEDHGCLSCGDRQSEIARAASMGAIAHRLAKIGHCRPMVRDPGVAGV
jgi:hypothetical protein